MNLYELWKTIPNQFHCRNATMHSKFRHTDMSSRQHSCLVRLGTTLGGSLGGTAGAKPASRGMRTHSSILALGIENDKGVPKDFGEAARSYRKAADQGFAQAQLNLGPLYYSGNGVLKGSGEPSRWEPIVRGGGQNAVVILRIRLVIVVRSYGHCRTSPLQRPGNAERGPASDVF